MGSHQSSSSIPSYIRKAHHAGSWYSDSADELDQQLSGFLADAASDEANKSLDNEGTTKQRRLRAVICPHAGYSYSGPTAAYSYRHVAQELADPLTPIRTILVLHPSHHVSMSNQCAVSGVTRLETPLGDLVVNDALRQEILATATSASLVTTMNKRVDEHEHSGEMQFPFLAKVIRDCKQNHEIDVLPVMVGQLSDAYSVTFGRLFASVVSRPSVLTVVSTDFCHWGSRFGFNPMPTTNDIPIHTFIGRMDRRGMSLIELQQPGAFAQYLTETRNTICGRNAVAVWLHAVAAANDDNNSKDLMTVSFVSYAQSLPVQNVHESSVSYAAAVAYTTT
ncbi:hypothetical protein MPSEU_000152000 [Mayamaea pseudoterrestris]|nr:hypothetical protein MPSEU_000152000 [Mayamaea pseudoterrestris]